MKTDSLEILRQAAKLSNFLAHQLEGTNQDIAFEAKTKLASISIIEGHAQPNDYYAYGIVGIDIGSDPPTRLHLPLNKLEPAARRIILKNLGRAR